VFFSVDRGLKTSIQEQLRTKIVAAILEGQLMPSSLLPSTRELARKLNISRTTVVSVYEKLVEDGFLISKDRSGFCVSPNAKPLAFTVPKTVPKSHNEALADAPSWHQRYKLNPSLQRNISKPTDWQNYRYPFVYGQPDPALFPLAAWRECSRQAMSELAMRDWSGDAIAEDDPYLIQEIRSKLLPRRGIFAKDEEILITAGAQNGLFLIASLLMNEGVAVGVEEPGYPDARNIFSIHGAKIQPLEIDTEGAQTPAENIHCDYLFLTPSHQSPTTITMSVKRREEFFENAAREDSIIIEDDFESDTNYLGSPVSAMKADDENGRVIYVGSLSKSMFPGLRLGYIVGSSDLIKELRALRRLVLRHVPNNNQRTTSLFISQGFHDTYVRKLNRVYQERWQVMQESIDQYLPGMSESPKFGGTSFWMAGGLGVDSGELAEQALKQSVVIEPGLPHFQNLKNKEHFFRLGFSSIPTERIADGVRLLSLILNK